MEVSRTRALVLLVDDSPTQGQRSAHALEAAGYRVRLASNGRDALEQTRRWRPDVIVSDVLMPVMDGFALCRELRRDTDLARVPLILHTMTYIDQRDEEFALGLGATRFVLKPSDPTQLVEEVRAALATAHLPKTPIGAVNDDAFLKGYSQRLAAKLEDKVLELEQAYRELELQTQEKLRHAELELAERARAEQVIRQTEARAAAVLEAALDCIVTIDHAGRILEFNPAAERTFGYRRADVLDKHFADVIIPPAGRDQVRDDFAHRVSTGEGIVLGQRVERSMMRADGSELPVEITITRLPTEGPPVFTGFMRELTERKQAEAALERLRRRHELILTSVGDGIVGMDTEGRTTFVNPAAARMLGYGVEELLGRHTHDTVHHTRPDGTANPREACSMLAALRDGSPRETQDEVFSRKDGTCFPVEAQTTPVRDGEAIVGAVVTFRDITQRRESELALQHQAWHDPLTGLPNRTRLQMELEQQIPEAESQSIAVIVVDLDGFRQVNDTFGHEAGDRLLQEIGSRFSGMLGDGEVLAHVGEHEFAFVIPGADSARAGTMAEELLSTLQRSFDVGGFSVEIGGSIGIALYPEHGQSANTLLRRADIALYVGKHNDKGYAIYAPEHDHHTPERLALIPELRRAIEQRELILYYQPQVDARTGALAAVEALVRWPHPERGLVSPDEFIPLAEQTRLIRPLTQFVLGEAIHQCVAWRAAGVQIAVSVNVSARDLQDATLPEFVAEVLHSSGLPADRLRLEITETSLMQEPSSARETLARLRGLGVQVAIDDFGTGHSSLAYLIELPVDELKIDKSFVRNMGIDENARALIRGVIDLAAGLDLRIVAEGVEDRETWEALIALGCDVVQGYYFGPPMRAAELAEWLDRLSDWRVDEQQRQRFELALAERIGLRDARLAAEEQFIARKRAEWALRESDDRLRMALEAAGMATWDWDLIDDTITWSNGAAGLFGDESMVTDRSPDGFLGRIHPDDRLVVEAAIADAVRNSAELRIEYRIVRPDGTVRWLESTGRVLRDPAGRAVRLLATHMDLTERKNAENQRQSFAQAEKLRALGQMASGVAHDLNQSLGLIAGYGELADRALAHTPIDTEVLHEALPIIAKAALDGGQTVRQLLTFARTTPDGQPELVQLSSLVREVAQLTAPHWRDATQAAGRPISLHVETDGDTGVAGWPASLREALTNLVFNSVDALPSGGTIRLSARRVGDQVKLEVADSGVGVSPEIQERIFEPFFTTKGERGTGLGLAQVFGVVQQHGGTIQVDSAPGTGTTFRIAFPAASPQGLQRADRCESLHSREHLRILAVDDEPLMGKMIARVLRPAGHQVVTATSGEEALDRLRSDKFDVLISDIGMGPGMNGWDLVERVRRLWPDLRVVVATGWGAAIDPAEARTRGVDVVIAKPYRPEELERVLAA